MVVCSMRVRYKYRQSVRRAPVISCKTVQRKPHRGKLHVPGSPPELTVGRGRQKQHAAVIALMRHSGRGAGQTQLIQMFCSHFPDGLASKPAPATASADGLTSAAGGRLCHLENHRAGGIFNRTNWYDLSQPFIAEIISTQKAGSRSIQPRTCLVASPNEAMPSWQGRGQKA
ncbi:hypothetical protein LY76DRAFT_398866 [Colletotrichum caudatum]|nr:hypothetical protein LY76DRAFT_398866 [Colletotrichum caudatum]